ncbi:hypothetical protein CAP35_12535 [Chitinophagaceae bacterium IBVUCB1]|nr:hypothetical protein CAP35_12535 [Chitinophagaceae bacterium IBVUCB1]
MEMKIALVDNIRTGATKGATGICPCCGSQVIARCGEIRVDHWAHKGARHCDPWWENETDWHRSWKGNFSADWQEVIASDEITGEKHIADIKTDYGLVIEFQHSRIDPVERRAREKFYKNMIWVVDGTRLKSDYPRFLKGQHNIRRTNKQGIFHVNFPAEVFPSIWMSSSVPIIFDYKGSVSLDAQNDPRNLLYVVLPKNDTLAFMTIWTREHFINAVIQDKLFTNKEVVKIQEQQTLTKRTTFSSLPYIYQKGRFVKRRRF